MVNSVRTEPVFSEISVLWGRNLGREGLGVFREATPVKVFERGKRTNVREKSDVLHLCC